MVLRLKKAFDAFFRRLKAGEAPGYPRSRGRGTLRQPDVSAGAGSEAEGEDSAARSKIVLQRPLEGVAKTSTLRRTVTGKRFVGFTCRWEPTPLPPTGREVGIDVGPKVFAMPTEGEPIHTPASSAARSRHWPRRSASTNWRLTPIRQWVPRSPSGSRRHTPT